MHKQIALITLIGPMLVAAHAPALATLVDLGNGTVQDTTTNLIWLKHWNVNGFKDFHTHDAWAQSLSFAGSSDWDLPSTAQWDQLHAKVGQTWEGLAAHFDGVQYGNYWVGDYLGSEIAHGRATWSTYPFTYPTYMTFSAVAVRQGAPLAPVPEASALALALAALVVLGGTALRGKRPTSDH